MQVLVTRPKLDAATLVAELGVRGVKGVSAPLLEITFVEGPAPELSDLQALLMTSANGVRAFARRTNERGLAVIAVGDATARAAVAAGFSDVTSAAGDVDDLAHLVVDAFDANSGSLLHPTGSSVAGNLAKALTSAGFTYRREIFYEASAAEQLPAIAHEGLRKNIFDGVVIYSPRTALIFKRLVAAEDLQEKLGSVSVYCLSRSVAEVISDLSWESVYTALRPEQRAFLELFE